MEQQSQNSANKTTLKTSTPTPLEIKPKFELGAVQITTIFCVILAAIAAYIGKILWHKRQRFINASEEFRNAFDGTIHALETTPFCDRNVLNESFRSHEKAMIKFRDNFKGRKLTRFNNDWEQYEQYCLSRVDVPLLFFIATEVSDTNGPNDSAEIDLKHRQKALQKIKKILAYTKK